MGGEARSTALSTLNLGNIQDLKHLDIDWGVEPCTMILACNTAQNWTCRAVTFTVAQSLYQMVMRLGDVSMSSDMFIEAELLKGNDMGRTVRQMSKRFEPSRIDHPTKRACGETTAKT